MLVCSHKSVWAVFSHNDCYWTDTYSRSLTMMWLFRCWIVKNNYINILKDSVKKLSQSGPRSLLTKAYNQVAPNQRSCQSPELSPTEKLNTKADFWKSMQIESWTVRATPPLADRLFSSFQNRQNEPLCLTENVSVSTLFKRWKTLRIWNRVVEFVIKWN